MQGDVHIDAVEEARDRRSSRFAGAGAAGRWATIATGLVVTAIATHAANIARPN